MLNVNYKTLKQFSTGYFLVNDLFFNNSTLIFQHQEICTVEPPCTTTSSKRLLPMNNHQSKTPKCFLSKPYS